MKAILPVLLFVASTPAYSQVDTTSTPTDSAAVPPQVIRTESMDDIMRKKRSTYQAVKFQQQPQEQKENLRRVGFIAGFGMNNAMKDIYRVPTIDEVQNFVRLEKDEPYRANFSFGISYTFGDQYWTKYYFNEEKTENQVDDVKQNIRGTTFCLFLNPSVFGSLSSNNISTPVDMGFGMGYRWGHFSIFGTLEMFRLSQPRQYFIDKYYKKELAYVVDGQNQTMIDPKNDNIFVSKWYTAVGVKFCYTLNIITKSKEEVDNQ